MNIGTSHWENLDRLSRWKNVIRVRIRDFGRLPIILERNCMKNSKIPVGIIQRAYAGTPIEGLDALEHPERATLVPKRKTTLIDFAERRRRNQGEYREGARDV